MSDTDHLKQDELTGTEVKKSLETFGKWLQEDSTNFEENKAAHFWNCTDSRLAEQSTKLLRALGINNTVRCFYGI